MLRVERDSTRSPFRAKNHRGFEERDDLIGGAGGSRGEEVGPGSAACLYLLFPAGGRPDGALIQEAVAGIERVSISHRPPASEDPQRGEGSWLELLSDGLTFDLLGLAPGPSLTIPEPRHHIDRQHNPAEELEAVGLAPGPHLAAAAGALPVVRTMLAIGVGLSAQIPRTAGFLWRPSGAVIGAEFFRKSAQQWLTGGPFPALGLTGIAALATGGLRSDGLDFFTGQEVEIEPSLCTDPVAGMRLAVRVIDLLVGAEALREPSQIETSDASHIVLEPSGDGGTVKVSKA